MGTYSDPALILPGSVGPDELAEDALTEESIKTAMGWANVPVFDSGAGITKIDGYVDLAGTSWHTVYDGVAIDIILLHLSGTTSTDDVKFTFGDATTFRVVDVGDYVDFAMLQNVTKIELYNGGAVEDRFNWDYLYLSR